MEVQQGTVRGAAGAGHFSAVVAAAAAARAERRRWRAAATASRAWPASLATWTVSACGQARTQRRAHNRGGCRGALSCCVQCSGIAVCYRGLHAGLRSGRVQKKREGESTGREARTSGRGYGPRLPPHAIVTAPRGEVVTQRPKAQRRPLPSLSRSQHLALCLALLLQCPTGRVRQDGRPLRLHRPLDDTHHLFPPPTTTSLHNHLLLPSRPSAESGAAPECCPDHLWISVRTFCMCTENPQRT